MNDGFSLRNALTDVLSSLSGAVADFLPRALTALVVVLFGLLLAKLAQKAIRTAFERLKINDLLDRVGVQDLIRQLGLQEPAGHLLGKLVYWLLMLLFLQSGAQAVGLAAVADSITAFFAYLPNLLAALIVVMIGMLAGRFAGGAVTRSARDSGVEFAPLLGRLVSALIIFVAGLMAVTQLRIDTEVIRSVVLVLLAGASLALALTFGLGTREITRNMVAGFYARKLFKPGDRIEIAGRSGTLAGISPVQVIIEEDGGMTTVPNKVFLEEAVRQ